MADYAEEIEEWEIVPKKDPTHPAEHPVPVPVEEPDRESVPA